MWEGMDLNVTGSNNIVILKNRANSSHVTAFFIFLFNNTIHDIKKE